MMVLKDLIKALKRMKVETGSLVCLGCGYEHNCGVHGCRILRETENSPLYLPDLLGGEE